MNIPMTVQITLVCGRLWRTKQERKEVTSAYRKWWTRGSYRWDIRLSQSTSTDKVEVRKSHKNISWWMIQKSLILNTLHHLGKVDANYIADWSCLHLCMGLLCFNSSYFKSKQTLFNSNNTNIHFFLYTFSYKWMVPFTYTTDANIRWTNPDFLWMKKSDGNSLYNVDFIIVKAV